MLRVRSRLSPSLRSFAPHRLLSTSGKFTVPKWATVDPWGMSGNSPGEGHNLCGGKWCLPSHGRRRPIVDPLNGENFLMVPDTTVDDTEPFVKSLNSVSKSGIHNPLKNPERYAFLGELTARIARRMHEPEVMDFFTKLIQRVTPKHEAQCFSEVKVTRQWLESFSGDSVRQLGRSFGVPGDKFGQTSIGYRWPFGPVCVITPFNFPVEIPALQTFSSIFMGNRPLLKVDDKVAIAMEQFVRLAIDCGLDPNDMDYLYSEGPVMNKILVDGKPRMTCFTGSQHIAEKLCRDLNGKIKLEDAGFDWKILGPDIGTSQDMDYVAWQADQDAYAFSGQKCSAQSMLFMHENYVKAGFLDRLKKRAEMRNINDLTAGPVLTWSNEQITAHMNACLEIPGAKLLWGGKPLPGGENVPKRYGCFQPTAVYVPLEKIADDKYFALATTELFGPFQIITEYKPEQLSLVQGLFERLDAHLTAGVVSNDVHFLQKILSESVNGTTYSGRRGRCTGAPANHWFGPAGDPRSAGIHTIEAIKLVWSCHREIVMDQGPVPEDYVAPPPT